MYALISHQGELLLPFAFTSIEGTTNEDILKIKMSDIVQGYYIISTGQTILNAEDFKVISTKEYSFLIENEWKNHIFVYDKYECVN